MSYQAPSDFAKIAELKAEQDKIRDILFFQGVHGVSQTNPFGPGGKNPAFGSKLGADSWFPFVAAITDINEALVATGIFDKLNIQSIANVVVGPVGTLILKTIQHVSDGKIFSLTPGIGRTLEITPGDNIEVASTLTLTDKDMVFMQYFKDTDKVKIISSTAVSSGGANTALSNLITTSINQNLLPQVGKTVGDSSNIWSSVFTNRLRLGTAGVINASENMIIADAILGMKLNVPLGDIFDFRINDVPKATIDANGLSNVNDVSTDQLTLQPTGVDPLLDGIIKSISGAVKVKSGGSVRNFSKMAEVDKANTFTNIQTFTNQVNLNANSVIGDSTSDNVTILARVTTDFDPDVSDSLDMGRDTLRWQQLFLGTLLDIVEGFADGFAPTSATNRAKLFCRPSSSGKTQLRVKFQTGNSVLIAVEP